jgi:RNA polymerase sigma-70 factor (ECF subfamily)
MKDSKAIHTNEIARLIEENRRLLYKVVQGYCSDVHEQEDLIQEIIFQLLKNYDRFDHKVNATTWMYKVAFNVSISHYRKMKTRKKYIVSMPEKLVKIDDSKTNEVIEDIIRLRKFIQELQPLNKASMIMYLDGNSHTEISEAMGISVSNVGTKINRIKQQLKKKFIATP